MLTTKEVAFAVFFSVVLVFNIAGNSLVIYIITNERGMKTSTNYLLLSLAVADLLFGVFLAPKYIFLPFFLHSLPDGVLSDWLCKLVLHGNIAWMATRVCIFTMLCLSVERYFAVCRPHTFSQRFSPKIVKVLVVVSWVYAVVMASPLFFHSCFRKQRCDVEEPTITVYSVYTSLEIPFSLLLMIILSTKICISLWCKQTVEPTGEREITERKKKKKVTYCVVAVVVTFVVCWVPVVVFFLPKAFSGSYLEAAGTALVVTTSVNAALDPYLFSCQSSRFKFLVKKVIFCRRDSS